MTQAVAAASTRSMASASTVAYINAGDNETILKQLVTQACLQHKVLYPVLPLEHDGLSYCLRAGAAPGDLSSRFMLLSTLAVTPFSYALLQTRHLMAMLYKRSSGHQIRQVPFWLQHGQTLAYQLLNCIAVLQCRHCSAKDACAASAQYCCIGLKPMQISRSRQAEEAWLRSRKDAAGQ